MHVHMCVSGACRSNKAIALSPPHEGKDDKGQVRYPGILETYLPAMVSEFSSNSLDPFLIILHVCSPLVQG